MGITLSKEVRKCEILRHIIKIAKDLHYKVASHPKDPEVENTIKNSVLEEPNPWLKKIDLIKRIFLGYRFTYQELINAIDALLPKIEPSSPTSGIIEIDPPLHLSDLIERLIKFAEKRSFPGSKNMSEEDSKIRALALALFASSVVRKEVQEGNNDFLGIISFLDRVFNLASLPKDEKSIPEDEKPYFILVSSLIKALNDLPTYSGKSTQVLYLNEKEQAFYSEGTTFAWRDQSIFIQGEEPVRYSSKANTCFIIEKSRTGRDVAQYLKAINKNENESEIQAQTEDEDQVVFTSGSTFIVVKKEIRPEMTLISLREVELGNTEKTIILVDSRADNENYEYKTSLDTFRSKQYQHDVSLVVKSSYTQAIAFLESSFGLRNKSFKIITILRTLQKDQVIDQDALMEFLKDFTFNVKPPFPGWLVQTRGEALECLFKKEEFECLDQNLQMKQAKLEGYVQGDFDSIDTLLSTNMTYENSKMIDPINPHDSSGLNSVNCNFNEDENLPIKEAKLDDYPQEDFDFNEPILNNHMTCEDSKKIKKIDPIKSNIFSIEISKDLNLNSFNQSDNVMNYVNGDLRTRALTTEESHRYK